MAQRLMGCLLVAATASLVTACKERSDKPIAGLLAAGAPVLRTQGKEQRTVAVGAQLTGDALLTATGPAVLEYFGGGLRFLEKGDTLEIGDADEAKLHGSNLPAHRWVEGSVQEAPRALRIVAARYTNVQVTPKSAHEDAYTSTQYFVAFFTPNGLQRLGSDTDHEGPHTPLPAPPFRPKVPFIHAGDLGEGGLVAVVDDGFAVAETDDLATAVLLEGREVPLGRTVRLLVPDGAEVTLRAKDGSEVEVEGPADLRLR
ncbi:hypothetical protein HUA74_16760 [Myxococcus sp. CA051A]|uniref:Lipoprotein n=1 Tax=Myxococcus llanfairpwllgwyngyllgogerychwyrndrobwllllantysiliogogogochensis TaxID=2590453 RepID=A0A540WN88_9BACT|nr:MULTISPECIES: hypothetical protein [Myxococcus]NTX13688.1 hypothetical protein [Myxococcus sp. CA056]NTX38988.1 hypothetical protein [Myxococcus sp. CA033]NTX53061.1 hypothetical protein [Myxococcus sp. CA039A]NTX62307.1 hypothetical protein [Myxococcus sp. CA051A]TQF10498.1 hypothetical protein FJV41_39235 [Myxococcus llanfairpwllgwyngyllgogerychwyrndrobwllllantysiliogogogochensis]